MLDGMSGLFHIVCAEKTPVGSMHFMQNGEEKKRSI